MKEYELLFKVLEDTVQQIQERNIREDHNIHMSINKCDDNTNAGDDGSFKFDIGPYINPKDETYHTSIVQFQKCMPDAEYCKLLTSLNQKQSAIFTHIQGIKILFYPIFSALSYFVLFLGKLSYFILFF